MCVYVYIYIICIYIMLYIYVIYIYMYIYIYLIFNVGTHFPQPAGNNYIELPFFSHQRWMTDFFPAEVAGTRRTDVFDDFQVVFSCIMHFHAYDALC